MQNSEVEVGPNRPETRRNAGLFPPAVKTTKTQKVADSEFLSHQTKSQRGSGRWKSGVPHSNMPRAKGQKAELEEGRAEEGPGPDYSRLESKHEFFLALSRLSEKRGPAGGLAFKAFPQKSWA